MDWKQRLEDRASIQVRRSYLNVSFEPTKRGASEIAEWADWLGVVIKQLPEDQQEPTYQRFERLWLARVAARGRTASPMITGPARFPVQRNQKAMAAERNHVDRLLDFKAKVEAGIARAAAPDDGPIMGNDPEALDKLQAKLAQTETDWANAKRWNAQFRKGGLDAMDAPDDVKAKVAHSMKVISWLKVPFGLTRYGPEVKRIKGRIAQIERKRAMPDVERELVPGVQLQIKPDEDRVRLIFSAKPARDVITQLKREAFRWAPSVGAWQRNYSEASVNAAKRVAGMVAA